MSIDDAIKAVLKALEPHTAERQRAATYMRIHEQYCLSILSSGATADAKAEELEKAKGQVWRALLELVPDLAVAADLMLNSNLDEEALADLEGTGNAPAIATPTVDSLQARLAIARDESEVWRGHVVRFCELWDAVGIYGFVCRDQSRVAELLKHVADCKRYTC